MFFNWSQETSEAESSVSSSNPSMLKVSDSDRGTIHGEDWGLRSDWGMKFYNDYVRHVDRDISEQGTPQQVQDSFMEAQREYWAKKAELLAILDARKTSGSRKEINDSMSAALKAQRELKELVKEDWLREADYIAHMAEANGCYEDGWWKHYEYDDDESSDDELDAGERLQDYYQDLRGYYNDDGEFVRPNPGPGPDGNWFETRDNKFDLGKGRGHTALVDTDTRGLDHIIAGFQKGGRDSSEVVVYESDDEDSDEDSDS